MSNHSQEDNKPVRVISTTEIVAIWHEIREAKPEISLEERFIRAARECHCNVDNVREALSEQGVYSMRTLGCSLRKIMLKILPMTSAENYTSSLIFSKFRSIFFTDKSCLIARIALRKFSRVGFSIKIFTAKITGFVA